MKSTFTRKMMLIYGSLLLIVITLTFLFSYLGTVRGLRNQLRETNLALLKQIDQKMEMAFQQAEKDLLQLANGLEFVYFMSNTYKDDPERYANFYAMNEKLSGFLNRNLHFSSIFVYSDKSGEILTEKTFMNKEMSENKWVTDYLNMKGYFQWLPTHQIWDGAAKRDVVTLIRSYPPLSTPGHRTGLLAVNMNESVLYQMIHDIYEEGYKGHTFVIAGNGDVVTHDDKSRLFSSMKELPYINRILNGANNGSFNIKLDGVKQSVFYTTSGLTGWKIVSIVPESQVYQPLTVTRNLFLVFSAVMFLIALVFIFFFSRKTFRPMDVLIGKLSGKYSQQKIGKNGLPHQGFSYLENVFDQMFLDRENLEQQVRDSKPMLKWRTVMDMLTGYRTDYSMVKNHLEFTGGRLFPEWFVAATAEIGKEGGIDPKDEMLYTYALCNVAEEIINLENAGIAIDLGGGQAVILFSFAEGDEAQNHLRAATLLEQILDVMNRQIGLTVTAGLGRCYKDMKDIPVSYEESRQALRYKMVTGIHTVISIEDLQAPDSQDYFHFVQRIDRILEALKQSDTDRMNALLNEAFHAAVKNNLSPDLIRQFSFELVMRAMQTMESIGIGTDEIRGETGNLHERIHQCENWKQTEQLVGALMSNLASMIEERRNQRGKSDTIDNILVYIQAHYQDSGLSLDQLADEFHLNPTYISKLFKEHAEGNFIDYLIETRIRVSKELLRDKNIRVNDIAEAVGYTNSRSFMRTFKKYTGLTPTEYRERILVHEEPEA
ncbi:MAG: hypothetical protein K0R57_3078 [Paenibacillaceae bacterium]|jgi:AraC-like DNA-binding protein|nr:hypothetical protein [Paenibacillaceae bacterium]